MESRAPVWTENGLWEKGDDPFNNMPRVLPFYKPTNLSGLSYWQDPWLDIAYFQRPKPGMEQYRIDFWEGWQSDRRTSGPSYHAKSGTLVGGTEGIVWIIRGNLKILANAGALMLGSGVELPTPLPEGYDGRRLSVGDFERALDWVKEWTDVIHGSITVLDTTYQERWRPADFPSHDPRPSNLDNDDQDNNVPVASGSGLRRASSDLGDDPWGDLDAGYEPNDHDSVGSLEPEVVLGKGKGKERENEREKGKGKGEGDAKQRGKEEAQGKGKAQGKEKGKGKAQGKGKGKGRPTATPASGSTEPKFDWIMTAEWVTSATPLQRAKLEGYVQRFGHVELARRENRKAHVVNFIAEKSEMLDQARKKTLPQPIVEVPQTAEERRHKYNEDLQNWTDKRYPLYTLPNESECPPCDAAPENMRQVIDTCIREVDRVTARWREDIDEWVPYSEEVVQAAAQLAFSKQSDFPQLEFAMALHGRFFLHSRSWDKDFSNLLMATYECLGCGSAILRRVTNLVEAGEDLGLDIGTQDHLRWLIFRLRQKYDQATRLGQLSLHWRNRLKDRFRYSLVAYTLEELVEIGGMLESWTVETAALYKQLEQGSFEQWVKADLTGFLRDPTCYFSYGCPLQYAFGKEAKAELGMAREVLANRNRPRGSDTGAGLSSAEPPSTKRIRPRMRRPAPETSDNDLPTGGQATTKQLHAGPGTAQPGASTEQEPPVELVDHEQREAMDGETGSGEVADGATSAARGDETGGAEAGVGEAGEGEAGKDAAEGESAGSAEIDA
ncbi:hypothetical protein FRC10_005419, partial [Ceratobasidium sp. 414]